MSDNSETIVINCSKDAVVEIQQLINAQPEAQSKATERKNLDGDVAGWIVIATLATQSLPHVLEFLKPFLPNKQITKIRFKNKDGEWEMENPTQADIERFRSARDATLGGEDADG